MKKPQSFTQRRCLQALALSLLLPFGLAASGEEGLADLMGKLGLHGHKLQLSLDHDNLPLADFYAHELEEVIEAIETFGEYHGVAVGPLTTAMLVPAFELLEEAIDSGVVESAQSAFDGVIDACNRCHLATGYQFIQIQRNPANPYLQSFEVLRE